MEKAREQVLKAERAKVEALVAANAALGGRSGGVYIPPHRMALLKQEAAKKADESPEADEANQKLTWEALRKSINGLVNKVSSHNLKNIAVELFKENIYRGRGLLCKSLMKSQTTSPKFTPVYAALIAIINTKMPDIGVLLLTRLVDQFKKGYRRRDKLVLLSAVKFIAHLVNHLVCGVVLPLQILLLLLERPTDDSIEVAVALMQELGQRLSEASPQAFNGIFDQFRSILHEGTIDKRVEYMIEGLFAVRRKEFSDFPAIPEELDLVEEEDQITHENITLEEEDDDQGGRKKLLDIEERLDFFKFDPNYKKHEQQYQDILDELLGDSDDDEDDSSDDDDPALATSTTTIEDATSSDITILKRAIYLTIMSSRDHEEVVHKLRKMGIKPGQEEHVCRMIIQCCSQERTYLKFYGLIAERFCNIDRDYQHQFELLFEENYTTIHRYDNNMLRNVARLFAHLLFTDALPWTVFKTVKLNERDTTASSRIFIKILFGDLVEYLGLPRLIKRVQHPSLLHPWLEGMFPTNSPKDCKFAINYWTAIELGALTDQLRTAYNDMIRKIAERRAAEAERRANRSGSSSDSSSGYSSSSSYSSSGSSRSSSSSGSYSSSSSSGSYTSSR
jgi:pre-mRNA-splicing factor CWC22